MGGAGGDGEESAARRKRKPKAETRALDLQKKKENRRTSRALLRGLWELEKNMRQKETPARQPGPNMIQPVLEDLLERVRGIVSQPVAAAPAPASPPVVPSAGDVRRGFLSSVTVGALYVCVEDWAVRECSKGMELVCPFEALRGYVGFELHGFVHSDDQHALGLMRLHIQNFTQGSQAPMVVTMRLLRVGLDDNVLVMDYTRLHFEVAHVGRDAAHGGKVHALLTCALSPDSVAPLTFTVYDRLAFQVSANAVSGLATIESHRIVKGETPVSEPLGDGDSQQSLAGEWLLRMASQTLGFADILKMARSSILSVFASFARFHAVLGVAPDGVPWVDKSSAVEALGISSAYKPHFVARLSGDLNWISLWTREKRPFLAGVLKIPAVVPGVVGVVSLGFDTSETPGGRPKICMHVRQQWTHNPITGVRHILTNLLFDRQPGKTPDLFELVKKGTGPPKPGLLAEFLKFDRSRVQPASEPRAAPFR